MTLNRIIKGLIFAGFLFFAFMFNLNAKNIKSAYFLNSNKNSVVETSLNGTKVYLIQATYFDNDNKLSNEQRNSKLNFLTRFILARYLKNKFNGVTDFKLSGLEKVEFIKSNNSYFLISKVPVKNISTVISKDQLSTSIDSNKLNDELDEEIKLLEKEVSLNSNLLISWHNLYNLYFIKGDLENANAAMDKIIALEF